MSPNLRRGLSFIGILVTLALLWEGYKWMGQTTGGTWPFTAMDLPVRTNERSMPHLWDIVAALFRPARRGGDSILLIILLQASLFTFRSAFAGFVLGSAIGFGLGVLFVRSALAERGLMPYVVASQTVPILAIAPILVVWAGRLSVPKWMIVAVISAYLAFFPIAINTLRGLRSPPATAAELMRSYAASPRQVLWKLQVPAAMPYLFPALRIAATASIIGAIVGELPASMPDGLGRAILNFAAAFSAAPEKLFASILVASLLGIFFVGLVALAERMVLAPTRRNEADAVISAVGLEEVTA
ncbi:MAG: ABC transporter permease [Acidimicrobiia bacterium]|nr:ABC transporter permease [Acidimicrobiia bacterium]